MKKRIILNVPEAIHRAAKIVAANASTSINTVCVKSLSRNPEIKKVLDAQAR
jgi:predicted HicB family RNase H-like nuclease